MSTARPRIYRPTTANLARLAGVPRRGGLVGVPAETVYGLAADALSAEACAGIFAAKGRPGTDPLIVHLASVRDLDRVAEPNAAAHALAEAFWPGPLTLVLPKRSIVPDNVTAGRPTVAVRVPAQPHFRRLIRLAGRPLAAPSANPFGYISPITAAHVRDGLAGTALRAVLDGGECPVGVESTIVDLTQPKRPVLLRPGGLAAEAVERVLGITLARPRRARLSARSEDIAAGIVGYIRAQSLGSPLIPYADRVDRALKSILHGRYQWTAPQRKWLERIGKQLHKEAVIDREAFNKGRWRGIGGFDAANRVFDGKLESLLGDLQAEVWRDSA